MESIKTEKTCYYCGKPGDDCDSCQEIFSKLCGRCGNVRGECEVKTCQTFQEVKKDFDGETDYKKRLFEKCQDLKIALLFILENVKLNDYDKGKIDFDIFTNNQEITELFKSETPPMEKITQQIQAGKRIIIVPPELRNDFGTFWIESSRQTPETQEDINPFDCEPF